MTQNSQGIKLAIAKHLDNLVGNSVLGMWKQIDLTKDPLDTTQFTQWPIAILGMDDINTSRYLDNRSNYRSYTFQILVMQKYDNINTDSFAIETLQESILDEFDNDPTLGGACVMMDAAIVPTQPISTPDKSYVVFLISLKCNAIINLTFNS